jgi:Spy/CpxP family protein refolding chaperone
MNATRNLTLALGLAAVLAAPALAQQGQGGPGRFGRGGMGFGGLSGLLMAEPVREELKLTDEQAETLRPILEEIRSETMDRFREMRDQQADLSGEERTERFEQMSRELNAKAREKVAAVLKPEQLARLEQIQLQQQGVRALAEPSVAEKLGLNEEQTSKIGEIIEAERAEIRTIMEAAGDAENPSEAFGKVGEVRSNTTEKVTAVLTDEQKSTWKEMTGEPFELPRGGFGGGRGGPGGGGGPRGGGAGGPSQ